MTQDYDEPKQAEVLDGKIFAVMAYVWGLCILPLSLRKITRSFFRTASKAW